MTFRLADSIPLTVMKQWQDERQRWLKAFEANLALAKKDPKAFIDDYLLVLFEEKNQFEENERRRFFLELDKCHGSCLLNKKHEIVAKSLEFYHGQRIWIGDYVVMPNHVHVIVQPFPGVKLEQWLYSVKRYSSTEIFKDISLKINEEMKYGRRNLWQAESYDRIVRNRLELIRIRRYIERNPSRLIPGSFSFRQMPWLDEFCNL